MICARRPCVLILLFLISSLAITGCSSRDKNPVGQSAISAVRLGDAVLLKKLIDHDEVEVIHAQENGLNILMIAVQFEEPKVVRLLLEAGASPNQVSPAGSTPLHEAVIRSNAGIVKLLLDFGGDTLRRDSSGMKPIDYADENKEICAMLHKDLENQPPSPPPSDPPSSPEGKAAGR